MFCCSLCQQSSRAAAADDLQSLPRAAQEAGEARFGGDDDLIPVPSSPEKWADAQDYIGGFWMLVEVDLAKVRAKAVRLNISLNEGLVQRIDAAAKARGQSRSAFLAQAAEREMATGWTSTSRRSYRGSEDVPLPSLPAPFDRIHQEC